MEQTKAEKARAARLKRLFNITPEEYDQIFEYQGGVCFICQKEPSATKRLSVDHLHASKVRHVEKPGLIRGLLCTWCNRRVIEDLKKLKRMLQYLEDPPAVKALGEERYGVTGRVTNRRKRKVIRKSVKPTNKRRVK